MILYKTSLITLILLCLTVPVPAQERPYFVTYSHEMEEPGNLDIEMFNAVGDPPGGNLFL